MEERTQNLLAGEADAGKISDDPEKTLVAPRFDAREVVTAQPVVPLADERAARRAPRQGRQGTLPILLILVSALVGGLVSVFAYRLYQQRVEQSSAREQQHANVEAPALTPEIPERAQAAEVPAATPEVIEEPQPDPGAEVAEVREAETDEAAAAREEARDDRAGRDLSDERERAATRRPTARRVEEITTPTEDLRVRRERYDGKEASDYEVPSRTRAERRATRRAERRAARRAERNIDRVRAIFEGPPPTN